MSNELIQEDISLCYEFSKWFNPNSEEYAYCINRIIYLQSIMEVEHE